MRYAVIVAMACLAACATPQEVRETGHKVVQPLVRSPALAAACMARNIEADRDVFTLIARPLDTMDHWELVMRNAPDMTLMVANVEPDAAGSRATIWLRAQWFYRRDDLVAVMIAGC